MENNTEITLAEDQSKINSINDEQFLKIKERFELIEKSKKTHYQMAIQNLENLYQEN